MIRSATFSTDRAYRTQLVRVWNTTARKPRLCNLIGLNPSVADEKRDDPTVTRFCVRALKWGFDGLIVTNVFAWKSTDPRELLRVPDPIGRDNDAEILDAAYRSELIVCGWGRYGALLNRAATVRKLLRSYDLWALRVSEKTGQPFHPLYLPYSLRPSLFQAATQHVKPSPACLRRTRRRAS